MSRQPTLRVESCVDCDVGERFPGFDQQLFRTLNPSVFDELARRHASAFLEGACEMVWAPASEDGSF